jgi:hypothetical protein
MIVIADTRTLAWYGMDNGLNNARNQFCEILLKHNVEGSRLN